VRVLLVAASASTTGGGEKHIADLMERLSTRGIEVALACPPRGDLAKLAGTTGVRMVGVDLSSRIRHSQMLALRSGIEAFAPDIVHAHGSRAALFTRRADRSARERVVYTFHGIHVDRAGSPVRRVLHQSVERALRSRTAHFITVCESDRDRGARLGILDPERTSVVHNGIEIPPDTERGRFRAELDLASEPLVLSVGRFDIPKDQRTLLQAWAKVSATHPSAVLALIGSGDLESELRSKAVGLGLGDALRFVAPRSNLGTAYADADLFVLSSLWEGFPYVILEAMAHGLPVVSTNVDGIPEAVDQGVSGLLVPPTDPCALADAISAVLSDCDAARRMGAAGRACVARDFTLDKMVGGIVAVYRQVVGE